MTYIQAKRSFFRYLSDNLSEKIFYDQNPKKIDYSKQHIRAYFNHTFGELISLGTKNYRYYGTIFCQVFTPSNDLVNHGNLVEKVKILLERNGINGIILRDISLVDLGIDNNVPMYQTNVRANFYYLGG